VRPGRVRSCSSSAFDHAAAAAASKESIVFGKYIIHPLLARGDNCRRRSIIRPPLAGCSGNIRRIYLCTTSNVFQHRLYGRRSTIPSNHGMAIATGQESGGRIHNVKHFGSYRHCHNLDDGRVTSQLHAAAIAKTHTNYVTKDIQTISFTCRQCTFDVSKTRYVTFETRR